MPKRGENIYKRKDGRWEGRYISGRYPNGRAKYTSIYGKSYREVKSLLEKRKGERIKTITPSVITIKVLMETWLSLRSTVIKESSYQRYEDLINCHILPRLGGIRVNCLTAEVLSNFIKTLQKDGRLDGHGGLSDKTVSDIICILRSALRLAGKNGAVNVETLFDVKVPSAKQKPVQTLGNTECEALTRSILAEPDIYGIAYLLALNLGLRLGEVCGLKWSDVDFTEHLLSVNRTAIRLKQGNHTKLTVQTPKTENSVRVIPLPAEMVPLLIRMKSTHSHDSFIITGSKTKPQDPRMLHTRFKRFLKDHGMRDISFHTLRHTFATRCIERGIDAKTLSEIVGHANVKTTLQLYVHPSISHKRAAVEAATVLSMVI